MRFNFSENIVPLTFVLVILMPQTQLAYIIESLFPLILAIYWNKIVKKPFLLSILITSVFIISFFISKISVEI